MYKYRLTRRSIILYGLTLEEFIKYDPPCKECLVQPTCLIVRKHNISYKRVDDIELKICEKLEKFLTINKFLELKLK